MYVKAKLLAKSIRMSIMTIYTVRGGEFENLPNYVLWGTDPSNMAMLDVQLILHQYDAVPSLSSI